MARFILLLHDAGQWNAEMSPEDMQQVFARYAAWSEALAAKGHLRGGEKLEDGTGRLLRMNGGQVSVTDGPYTESKEVIGGFFQIEAASYEEAVALSKDCPHLDFGPIEIRQIENVS